MKNKSVMKISMKENLETILQNVLDILETDDGKNFEEKKELVIRTLSKKGYSSGANELKEIPESSD